MGDAVNWRGEIDKR